MRRQLAAGALSALSALAMACGQSQAQAFEQSAINLPSTVKEVLVKVYVQSPEIQATQARLRGTDEEVEKANSRWRPTVSVTASQSAVKRETYTLGGRTQEVETTSAQVILSQPLFRGGRTIAEIRKTKALVRSGRAELRALENEVMLSGINVLADLNRDYAIDASFGESTRLLERTLAAVREMRSYKAATATDVSQVEARLARTRRGAASVREQLAQSIAEYVRITGEHPTSLSAEFEGPDVMLSENALQNSAEGHPSVIGAKEAEIAAGHAVREAFGAIQPEVSLNAQYQYGYNQVPGVPTGVSQGTTTLYVQARWQFYQGGVEYASLRQAKALSEQRHSELIQTRREVQKAIAQAHAALIASKGALSASQAELQANMSAYEGVVTAQKGGEKSILDVLNATEEYLNARVAVARAKRDRVASAFQLIASIGQLTPERLALPVKRYDPTENYNQVVGSWIGFGK